MKKVLYGLILFFIFLSCRNTTNRESTEGLEGDITLSGAWAIYPIAVAWAEAFRELNPKVQIDISAGGAGKGVADVIVGLTDIGMVSRDPDPAEIKRGVVPIYILNDAIFPVVSDKNPMLPDLLQKGIKKKILFDIYITGIIGKWDDIIGRKTDKPVHVYTRSDACGAAAGWADYLDKKQEDLQGVGIYGDPGLLKAAIRDPCGIGYTNFGFVFRHDGTVLKGIKIVPIDSNENGIADPDEIFNDRESAINAIRSGRYPATRKNYFFTKGKPKGSVKEFINFALSPEGTKIADEIGTSLSISNMEREKILKELE